MLEELMCHINVTVSRGHAVRQSAKKTRKKTSKKLFQTCSQVLSPPPSLGHVV